MMKHFLTKLLGALLVLLFTANAYAGDNYWEIFPGQKAPSRLPMSVTPKHYSIFTLNQHTMQQFLGSLSTDPNQAMEIILPAPDHSMRTFMVWKTPIMAKALAEKYPEIQTYTAYALGDQNVTAKLDYTPYGFRGMILDGKNSYFIDPYSNEADGYYMVFYERDYKPETSLNGCLVDPSKNLNSPDEGEAINLNTNRHRTANRQNGNVRRTYRLAISCTGEYAVNAVGVNASVPLVLSKIVSTINRVNGVYQKELAVSFEIVAGDESIIYTDPNNDPYTCNANLPCLINEAQSNITSVIGAPNFDIGHIFCTAGGGLAALSSTCSGAKASGTSSSSGPDDFGVPLHEMGHQFGADHTFSANTGGCYGNGNPLTNFEPGSGSTIMSYAGVCDPNNIQLGSDNYFDVGSLDEINNFLMAGGSTCGADTMGPYPVAVANMDDTFIVPINTPFELTTAPATSNQSEAAITYNWEQFDVGNFGWTEAQGGSATAGGVMRSYPPDTFVTRAFPSYDSVIANSYSYVGVRLPQVPRALHFKLTARSVFQGWGTFNFIDSNVTVLVSNNAKFRVTAPASNATWDPNDVVTIKWDTGGSRQLPVNCRYVNIYLSLDNGKTFSYVVVSNAPNTGSYDYTVPDVYTTSGRIMVKGTGNAFFDIGKGKLNITGTNSIQEHSLSQSVIIYPNPAIDLVQVKTRDVSGGSYKIVMYNALGSRVWQGSMQSHVSIATSGMARGNYLIQVLDEKTGKSATYKVNLR
jgi:hypothetical protein